MSLEVKYQNFLKQRDEENQELLLRERVSPEEFSNKMKEKEEEQQNLPKEPILLYQNQNNYSFTNPENELIDKNSISVQTFIEEVKIVKKVVKEVVKEVEVIKAIKTDTDLFECKICLENVIYHTFKPCGHTACKTCSESIKKYHHHKCHVCRQKITTFDRIYF